MSTSDLPGARLAMWWACALTRTAPPDAAADRLAEIRADVHDHIMAGRARQLQPGALSRRIAGRALRGMPADITWRLEIECTPERLRWHLRHPGTIVSWLFVPLVLVTLLESAAERMMPAPHLLNVTLRNASLLLSVCLLAFVLAAAIWQLAVRRAAPENAPAARLGSLPRMRRATTTLLGICLAVAGLWRFSPGPLGAAAAWAWAAFGVCLLVYLAAMIAGGVRGLLSR
jgi:hypothetical protein